MFRLIIVTLALIFAAASATNVKRSKDDIKKLTAKLRATTFGITVPYPLPEEVADVCRNLMYGAICPIYKTEDVVYKLNFFVEESYPEIVVKTEVSLIDEDEDTIVCFIVEMKVKKSAVKP